MGLLLALALAAAAPPGSCAAALGRAYEGPAEEALPGRVDGAALGTPADLIRLRRERGDAPITIVGGSFADADFRAAALRNICFVDTDFSRSDWRGADASGSGFVRANFAAANLYGVRMAGAAFRDANLEDADASGADWRGVRIEGGPNGSLAGLLLDRADLGGFEFACGITVFDGCPVDRPVSLRGANLGGARLDTYWGELLLAGARIDRTEVALHQLRGVAGATFAGPLLLRGGESVVEVSADEHRTIVAAMAPPRELEPDAPSFDCAAARRRIERMICAPDSYGLRDDDRRLAAAFRRALAADPSLAASQRAWLARRDRCRDADCVARAYAAREGRLLGAVGPPAWLRPGVRALFVDDPAVFADAFRETALYRRIVPALVGGASSRVAIRVNEDGTIDAQGDAIGGNAHMCGLGGRRLRFDPATGWYSGPWSPDYDGPPDLTRPPMRVLLFQGDRVEVFRGGRLPHEDDPVDARHSDYASCGARAGFEEMVRVPVPDAEVERIMAEIGQDD